MATRTQSARSLFDMNARSVRPREGASPAQLLSRIGRPVYQYRGTGSTANLGFRIADPLPDQRSVVHPGTSGSLRV
jgi:hypothetical protein